MYAFSASGVFSNDIFAALIINKKDLIKNLRALKRSSAAINLSCFELKGALSYTRQVLPQASRLPSLPRFHHVTKLLCFAGIMSAKFFGGMVAEFFSIAGIDDAISLPIQDAQQRLNSAEEQLAIAQQNRGQQFDSYTGTYTRLLANEGLQLRVNGARAGLGNLLVAQRVVASGVVGVEAASLGTLAQSAMNAVPAWEKNRLGKFCEKFRRWVGPISILGALQALPSVCTALRSERTALGNIEGLILVGSLKKTLGSQHPTAHYEALTELGATMKSLEVAKVPRYVRAATIKNWANVLIANPELQGALWSEGNAALPDVGADAGGGVSKIALQSELVRYGKYHTAHQLGLDLDTLSSRQKVWAGSKAVWSGFKYGLNRMVRHSVIFPNMALISLALTHKQTPPGMLKQFIDDSLDTRADFLRNKAATLKLLLPKGSAVPVSRTVEMAVQQ